MRFPNAMFRWTLLAVFSLTTFAEAQFGASGRGRQVIDGQGRRRIVNDESDGNNNLGLLVGELVVKSLVNGIENDRRRQELPRYDYIPPQNRPQWRPVQPEYFPSNDFVPEETVVQPNVVNNVIPNTITPNDIPKPNELPEPDVTPADNVSGLNLLDDSVAQHLSDILNAKIDDELKTLSQLEADFTKEDGLLDNEVRDRLPADKKYLADEARKALKDGDAEKLKETLAKIDSAVFPPYTTSKFKDWSKQLVSEVDVKSKVDDVKKILEDPNASQEDKHHAIEHLKESLANNQDTLGLPPSKISELKDAAEGLDKDLYAIESLWEDLNNDQLTDGPGGGLVSVLTVPPGNGMSNGDVFIMPDGSIVVVSDRVDSVLTDVLHPEDYLGISFVTVDPVEDQADPAKGEGSVLVSNSEDSRGVINFSADGDAYTLKPGYEVRMGGATVTFDRGGSFGSAEYSLESGDYYFKVGDQGWELYAQSYTAVIDNSANRYPFNYVYNNQQQSVSPGETNTHEGGRPISIIFSRGDNGEPASKVLGDGTFRVAVNPKTGFLDLFDASTIPEQIAQAPSTSTGYEQTSLYPSSKPKKSSAGRISPRKSP